MTAFPLQTRLIFTASKNVNQTGAPKSTNESREAPPQGSWLGLKLTDQWVQADERAAGASQKKQLIIHH